MTIHGIRRAAVLDFDPDGSMEVFVLDQKQHPGMKYADGMLHTPSGPDDGSDPTRVVTLYPRERILWMEVKG